MDDLVPTPQPESFVYAIVVAVLLGVGINMAGDCVIRIIQDGPANINGLRLALQAGGALALFAVVAVIVEFGIRRPLVERRKHANPTS